MAKSTKITKAPMFTGNKFFYDGLIDKGIANINMVKLDPWLSTFPESKEKEAVIKAQHNLARAVFNLAQVGMTGGKGELSPSTLTA